MTHTTRLRVATVALVTPSQYQDLPAAVTAYRAVRERLDATPGIAWAALTSTLPLGGALRSGVGVEGRPMTYGERQLADLRLVTPGYFRTMRIAPAATSPRALVLAGVGVYGMIAYSVGTRRRPPDARWHGAAAAGRRVARGLSAGAASDAHPAAQRAGLIAGRARRVIHR